MLCVHCTHRAQYAIHTYMHTCACRQCWRLLIFHVPTTSCLCKDFSDSLLASFAKPKKKKKKNKVKWSIGTPPTCILTQLDVKKRKTLQEGAAAAKAEQPFVFI